MHPETLIDKAVQALQNADRPSRLYAGLPAETAALVNPYLAKLKLPPVPEDYLQLLRKTNGCDGPYFNLFSIDRIDHENGTFESAIIDEAERFNRYEDDDDVDDKGLILGYLPARMVLAYKYKEYHILDEDSYLPLSNLYHHIADFITETIAADDARTRAEKQ